MGDLRIGQSLHRRRTTVTELNLHQLSLAGFGAGCLDALDDKYVSFSANTPWRTAVRMVGRSA